MDWIEERHEDFYSQGYKVTKRLFVGQSEFQKVEVVETEGYGRMLFNDSLAMVSDRDEFVYHEMIAHVPLCVHPRPTRVLVIGGGDGGTAREVVRHQEVEKCVVVEIDEMVVQACKEHVPTCSVGFSHPKVELIIGDGVGFVAKHKNSFDVVLVDSTDPIGPATPLFDVEFYRNVRGCLKEDGIVVSQGESPWYGMNMQKKLLEIKKELFSIVSCYNYNKFDLSWRTLVVYLGGAKISPCTGTGVRRDPRPFHAVTTIQGFTKRLFLFRHFSGTISEICSRGWHEILVNEV